MIALRGMSFVYTFQRYSDNALYNSFKCEKTDVTIRYNIKIHK